MSNWFCPALLPDYSASLKIARWASEQEWPVGTELKRPSRYHTTLMYAPDVPQEIASFLMEEHFSPRIGGHWSHEAWTSKVSAFTPADPSFGTPVVIELHAYWLTHRWNETHIRALAHEWPELNPAMYERYQPHITVATLPPGAEFEWRMPPHVNFLFEPEPVELRSYYRSLRS